MVYLKKSAGWPNGAVHLTGQEGSSFRTSEPLRTEAVYVVLARIPNPDMDWVRANADAFFRGSEMASYTACELGELSPDGRNIKTYPDGALVVLRDGTRYLIATGSDGTERDGVVFGSSKAVILGDRD